MKNVLAIILGGGQGRRLFPLTKFRAKPAVPIGGKFRLIDIPISNCLHWDIKKIFILTQFNTMSLHKHITNTYKFDGFSKGFLHILAAQQTIDDKNWYQGTADAVRKNLRYIKPAEVDYIVVLSGDQLYRINISEFINFHIKSMADITIASKPINRKDAQGLGILKIDHARRITDFAEKPEDKNILDSLFNPSDYLGGSVKENYLASMGIYIFNKNVLFELLEKNTKEDFGKEIINESIKEKKVFSFIFDSYWEDIGTMKSFFKANLDFTVPVPQFNFYDEVNPIYSYGRFLPGSKIRRSEIDNSLISEGSIIENSKISGSVVGVRSIVEEGSELNRVVMMGADFYQDPANPGKNQVGVGKNCFLKNVIIDKNVRIGDGVVIDYRGTEKVETDLYHIIDGIVVIPKNIVIPNNMKIE